MKTIQYTITFLLISLGYPALADKLFVSNNAATITMNKAYKRLTGTGQENLINHTIQTLQADHYEQGTFNQGIGAYTMQNNNQTTGDNTLVFTTSPKQFVSSSKLMATATTLANQLNQESVALFIASSQNNMDARVIFSPGISYSAFASKLATLNKYNLGAFTLYFSGHHTKLANTFIHQIEWLTTPSHVNELKQLFPNQTIHCTPGSAWLVFKDGHAEPV